MRRPSSARRQRQFNWQRFRRQIKVWFRQKIKPFLRIIWKFVRRETRFSLILLVTIVIFIVFCAIYLLPYPIPFEGNLVVEELGFTTTQVQPFLDKVQVKELIIRGQQTYVFNGFKGDFESKTVSQIKELDKLTISVQDADSSLIIAPVSTKEYFQLSQLNLPANTQVSQLRYEPNPLLQIGFSLPEKFPNDQPRLLTLNLGVPLQITVQGSYKIAQLNQQNLGTFTFTTQALGDYKPLLPVQTILRIKLYSTEQDVFFGNNAVKEVRLAKEERLLTGKEGFNYNRSSIRSGVIRVASQTVNIEKDQFIQLGLRNCADKDGCEEIKKIPYIRLVHNEIGNLQIEEQKLQVSDPSYGLEVGISGEASRFELGINPNLPIKTIQGNYNSRIPSDIANFLMIVFTSLFSGLFTWLLSNLPQINPQGVNRTT